MAITTIRSAAPAARPDGFHFESARDRIGANEGGQLVIRLDIPLPDFADPTKSVSFRIEWQKPDGSWELVVGGRWVGKATFSYRDPVTRQFLTIPSDPSDVNQWAWVAVDLDGDFARLKGEWIRGVFDVPVAMTVGATYERRTDPNKLS